MRNDSLKNVDNIVNSGRYIGCAACVSLCPFGTLKPQTATLGSPSHTKARIATTAEFACWDVLPPTTTKRTKMINLSYSLKARLHRKE